MPMLSNETAKAVVFEHPPISAVSAEITFTSGIPWRSNFVVLMGQYLREVTPNAVLGEEEDTVTFYSIDGNDGVHVSEDNLTIFTNQSYGSWRRFGTLIGTAINTYVAVAKPDFATGVKLQYINHVEVPLATQKMADYFNLGPWFGEGIFEGGVDQYYIAGRGSYEDRRDSLDVTFSSDEVSADGSWRFVIDLTYELTAPVLLGVDLELGTWFATAHGHTKKSFLNCLTEGARQRFGEK